MVATYITIESPYSGMSMNPARTFGSALPSGIWHGFLIYLIVPPVAMLAAAEVFVWRAANPLCNAASWTTHPRETAYFAE